MIRALFFRNLRHHLRLLLALSVGAILFELLLVWTVAQIDQGPGLAELLQSFVPAQLRALFESQFGMASFSGGVAFGFQHPLILVLVIAFCVTAATVPAAERESGLLDVLLSHPVSRTHYALSTLGLVVAGAVVLPLAVLAGAVMGLAAVETPSELPWTRYLPSAAGLSTLLLAIGGYSALIAAGCRRRGPAVSWAVGITAVAYWIDVMAALWSPLQRLRWLSPFDYFDPIGAAVNRQMPVLHVGLLLAVAAVTMAGAVLRFRRQDL